MTDRKNSSNYGVLKRQAYLSLTDIAYRTLVEGIINQDFKPGVSISIDSLAKQLGMSNTPVREALMRAHGERLVTQKTNHGFIVANILTPDELHHLFDVRYLIEIHALSSGEISPEAVQMVTGLVEQMGTTGDGKVYDDFHEYMTLDHQFHYALVGMAGNHFLQDAWEDLHVHLHLSRLYTGVGLFDRSDSTKEHQAILEALQRGEQATAVELLKEHILRVGRRMESFLEK
jgi:DNA-binding GntR family transcriptional regulator